MMVLSRVTVGSGYSDFLKGEGQKVYTHNLKAFGVCVCVCEGAPICMRGHHPHKGLQLYFTLYQSGTKNLYSVSLSLYFKVWFAVTFKRFSHYFLAPGPGRRGGGLAVSTVTSWWERPAFFFVAVFTWISFPPFFQNTFKPARFLEAGIPLRCECEFERIPVCRPTPHMLVYIAWRAECVYGSLTRFEAERELKRT